jgi:hypothetical protein
MRFASAVAVVLLITLAAGSLMAAAQGDLLTVSDVEKISGLRELHKTPKDQSKGAGGDLNFAGKDGKLVAMVMISTSMYDFWKTRYGSSAEPLRGVGDDGFRTKKGEAISWVVFRKGHTGVWIQSMGWKKDGSATLSDAQLTDLAKLAASRL